MTDLNLRGGTVVTAEASFRADVAVRGGRIAAVGTTVPDDGVETLDVGGRLLMPGFIDAHTHMDMPFGGTITADDWDSGTAAAVAGGTTVLVDFALQDIGAGAGGRHRHVAGQGDGADPDRLRPARRRLRPERRREGRDPRAATSTASAP